MHLNDSLKGLGSRVDRHAGIGRGQLGLEPFRLVVNDPRFRAVPMILETPKGDEDGEDLDAVNLGVLRGLEADRPRPGLIPRATRRRDWRRGLAMEESPDQRRGDATATAVARRPRPTPASSSTAS